MEKITLENIDMQIPNNINSDLIEEKGLGEDKPSSEYFELVNRYKDFFGKYLMELLPLEQIDNNMKNSKLNYVPIKDDDKDFYQITSLLPLTYIYIRNNFYIEKLSKEDLDVLRSKDSYDDEVREFIKRTFLSVINPYDDKEVVFYGIENKDCLCNSTDVVLGVRYDEFAETGIPDTEFQQRFLDQLKTIAQVTMVVELVGLEKLGTEVRLIHYNELSIVNKYYDSIRKQ